mmetsp:Transcript_12729/g.37873  ORF Transcript_12729/g.37873 Transcript_12729/m.37873 type:complete len:324 (+) Transcript_12729:92-1063(+)
MSAEGGRWGADRRPTAPRKTVSRGSLSRTKSMMAWRYASRAMRGRLRLLSVLSFASGRSAGGLGRSAGAASDGFAMSTCQSALESAPREHGARLRADHRKPTRARKSTWARDWSGSRVTVASSAGAMLAAAVRCGVRCSVRCASWSVMPGGSRIFSSRPALRLRDPVAASSQSTDTVGAASPPAANRSAASQTSRRVVSVAQTSSTTAVLPSASRRKTTFLAPIGATRALRTTTEPAAKIMPGVTAPQESVAPSREHHRSSQSSQHRSNKPRCRRLSMPMVCHELRPIAPHPSERRNLGIATGLPHWMLSPQFVSCGDRGCET